MGAKSKKIGLCALCNDGVIKKLTKHHTIPLTICKYHKETLMICSDCHNELNKISEIYQPQYVKDKVKKLGLKIDNSIRY